MSNDYDVIIIGSGAGGGTLAYRLAPTGLRILVLERGDYLQPRARELGQPRGDHEGPLQDPREVDRQGRAAVPPGPALLRRRADEVLRLDPLPPARDRLRRGPPPRRHLARVAALLRRPRAVLRRRPSSSTTCTARPARIRPRRGARRRYPYPAVSHEPRIQRLHDDFARAGLNPFHLPGRRDARRVEPAGEPVHPLQQLDGFPCMVEAKADAHVCAVRPALEHPNVTLLTNARVERLETDERGTTVTSVVVDRDGVPERYSATIVVVSVRRRQLRRAAAALGERAPPERARKLVRRRRPQLHGAPQLGARRGLEGARTRRASRRPSASTTSTTAPTTWTSRSGTSRCSASPTARCIREGAPLPGARASRSTTSPTTRSTSGSPPRICPTRTTACTVDRAGAHPRRLHGPNTGGAQAADRQAEGPADAPRLPRRR